MRRRTPFPVRLAYAVAKDVARVTCALAQWFILDPSLCRIVGHDPLTMYDPDRTFVVTACVRCGRAC